MPGDDLLLKLFSQESPPKYLDAQLLKHGLKAATYSQRSSSEQQGYDWLDLDDPAFNGDGHRSKAFVPKQYAKDPELFWYGLGVPLPQVGTYLKGQGLVESDGLALALDIGLDPTNLVAVAAGPFGPALTAGKFGLKAAGRAARAVSWASKAGSIEDAGKAVDYGLQVLEDGWKLAGSRETLLTAAKSGDSKAIKEIVAQARKTGKLTKEQSEALSGLRQNRKHLAVMFKHADEIRKSGEKITPEVLRQPTLLEASRLGQIAPHPFGVIIPKLRPASSPVKERLKFFGELVGWEFQDTKVVYPAADLVASSMDALGMGRLQKVGEKEFAKDALRYKHTLEVEAKTKATLRGMDPALRATKIPGWHAAMAIQALKVVNGTPLDHLVGDAVEFGVDERTLKSDFRAINGLDDRVPLNKGDDISQRLDQYVRDRMHHHAGTLRAVDNVATRKRESMLSSLVDELDQWKAAGKLDEAVATGAKAQLRALGDLFSLRGMRWETATAGQGLSARSSLLNLLSRAANNSIRAILKKSYVKRPVRDKVNELLSSVIEHPGLWAKRDGKYVLLANPEQARAAGAHFLARTLEEAERRGATAGLTKHLQTEGLDQELSLVVSSMDEAMAVTGKNLLHEGVIRGLLNEYFPHVFNPNSKFWKKAGKDKTLADVMPHIFSGDTEGEVFERLFGESFAAFLQRAHTGTVSLQEVRKVSEAMALTLEAQGMGKYVRDSSVLFSGYMAAAGNALLYSRLFNDLPRTSGFLTPAAVTTFAGKEAADSIPEKVWRTLRRVNIWADNEVPPEVKGIMRRVQAGALGTPEMLTEEALRDKALLSYLNNWGRSEDFHAALARERAKLDIAGKRLSDQAFSGGIKVLDELYKAEAGLAKEVERINALGKQAAEGTQMVALEQGEAMVGKRREALQRAWARFESQYGRGMAQLDELHGKILTHEAELHDLSRHKVAQKLAGSKTVGGIRLKLNGKSVGFDPNWLINGQLPEGLEGIKGIKEATKKMVADELNEALGSAAHKKLWDQALAIGKRLTALDERLAGLSAKTGEAVGRNIDAVEAAEKRLAASQRQAARTFDRSVAQWKPLEAAPGMAQLRARYDRLLKPYELADERTHALREASQRLGSQRVRARLAHVKGQVEERLAGELAEAAKARQRSVWVFEQDYRHLAEAFRLYEHGDKSKFWRAYDLWNSRVKGFVLLGDVFHFNTLAVSSFLAHPEDLGKLLYEEVTKGNPGIDTNAWRMLMNRPVLKGVIFGAAAGAGIGEMRGGDEGEVTAFSLIGLLYGAVIGGALKNAREVARLAMNPEHMESLKWMGLGGWTGRPDDRSIGLINRGLHAWGNRMLADSGTAGLGSIFKMMAEGADAWDELLWATLHNGSKHYFFYKEWTENLAKLEASEAFGEAFLRKQFLEARNLPPEGGAGPAGAVEPTPPPTHPPGGTLVFADTIEGRHPTDWTGETRFNKDGTFQVIINRNQPPQRQAVTLGHELTHIAIASLSPDRQNALRNELMRLYPKQEFGDRMRAVAKRWGMGELAVFTENAASVEVLADAGSMALMDPKFLKHIKERAAKLGSSAEGLSLLKDYETIVGKVKEWVQWVMNRLRDLASFTAVKASGASPDEARQIAELGKKILTEYADILDERQLKQLAGEVANVDPQFSVGGRKLIVPMSEQHGLQSIRQVATDLGWKHRGRITFESPNGGVSISDKRGLVLDTGTDESLGDLIDLAEKLRRPVGEGQMPSNRVRVADALDFVITHAGAIHEVKKLNQYTTARYWIKVNEETGDLVIHLGNRAGAVTRTFVTGRRGLAAQKEALEGLVREKVPGAKKLAEQVGAEAEAAKGKLVVPEKPAKAKRVTSVAQREARVETIAKELAQLEKHPDDWVLEEAKRLARRAVAAGQAGDRKAVAGMLAKARESMPARISALQDEYRELAQKGEFKTTAATGTAEDITTPKEAQIAAPEEEGPEAMAIKKEEIEKLLREQQASEATIERALADADSASAAAEKLAELQADKARLAVVLELAEVVPQLPPDLRAAWEGTTATALGGRGLSYEQYAKEIGRSKDYVRMQRHLAKRAIAEIQGLRVLGGDKAPKEWGGEVAAAIKEGNVTKAGALKQAWFARSIRSMPPYAGHGFSAELPLEQPRFSVGPNEAEVREFIAERRHLMKLDLAKQIVHTSNTVFGGLHWAEMLNNPQFQHQMRRFLLSPDWTMSRLEMTSSFVAQLDSPAKAAAMGAGVGQLVELADAGWQPENDDGHRKGITGRGPVFGAAGGAALWTWAQKIKQRMETKGDVMHGKAARLSATALVAGYVFANLMNKAFTGKFMFENEEGKRTSVAIGHGDYVGLGKPWTEAFEFGSFLEPEKYPIPIVSRLASKAAGIPGNAVRLFSNSNYFGGPIFSADDGPVDVAFKAFDFGADAVTPIMFQGIVRYGGQLAEGTSRFGGADLSVALMRGQGLRVSAPMAGNREPAGLADIMSGLGVTPLRDLATSLGGL